MEYIEPEGLPKYSRSRSKRLRKKLHLDEFTQVFIDYHIVGFTPTEITEAVEEKCYDLIYNLFGSNCGYTAGRFSINLYGDFSCPYMFRFEEDLEYYKYKFDKFFKELFNTPYEKKISYGNAWY